MTKAVVFGFDAAESSQIRRIRSLMESGVEVIAFTMRRSNMAGDTRTPWPNIHLFNVQNERLARRLAVLVASVGKIAWNRKAFQGADVIIARNFDLLLLAHIGRLISGRWRVPIVYECLDIHASFTGKGMVGRVFRALERALLSRTELLVVSSPGFIRNYFTPVQHYRGRVHLMENKIWFGAGQPERPQTARTVSNGRPWVIGWVGSLRCEPSFRILIETARRLGDRVRIEMYGNVHAHVVPDFEARIRDLANIVYHGPYAYPDGLRAVYEGCDLVWSQDLWQRGANSDWLLPNRIYEASYFGCLSIAVAGTETGRKVETAQLGYTIPDASADALVDLIETLDPKDFLARKQALLSQDADRFVYSTEDIRALIADALGKAAARGRQDVRARISA